MIWLALVIWNGNYLVKREDLAKQGFFFFFMLMDIGSGKKNKTNNTTPQVVNTNWEEQINVSCGTEENNTLPLLKISFILSLF